MKQKYVTIHLRGGKQMTLTFEQAEKILNSEQQIIKISEEDGSWTGKALNKADIVCTERDRPRERNENRVPENRRVPDDGGTAGDSPPVGEMLEKYRPEFIAGDESEE